MFLKSFRKLKKASGMKREVFKVCEEELTDEEHFRTQIPPHVQRAASKFFEAEDDLNSRADEQKLAFPSVFRMEALSHRDESSSSNMSCVFVSPSLFCCSAAVLISECRRERVTRRVSVSSRANIIIPCTPALSFRARSRHCHCRAVE